MKITPDGKMAIIFARVWGVLAILFGLFLVATIIETVVRQTPDSDMTLSIIIRLVFAIFFLLAGGFFLRAKMSVK